MYRFNDSITDYINKHSAEPDDLLKELERQTHLKILRPQMLPGALQGKILEMFSCMINPKNILEIGTFTGYSTLCLAKGLQANGKIYTIEVNDELYEFTNSFFKRSEYYNNIEFLIGDAQQIISNIDEEFDLVFIDADKREYTVYYELVLSKVKQGGFIIADDVLWYGKVDKELQNNDLHTKNLIEFNNLIKNDDRVENVIFPIRDGLNIIRKL